MLALESEAGAIALAMAPRPASIGEVIARVRRDPRVAAQLSITTPENLARAAAIHSAVHGLAVARPECSAARIRLFANLPATLRAVALIGSALAAAFFAPGLLMALAGVFFVAGSAARFCAGLYDGVEHPLRRGRTPSGPDWPVYTVLVPLYREASVAADLVAAMARLDYPRARLDIKFLVEDDDTETRAALARVIPGPPPAGVPRPQPDDPAGRTAQSRTRRLYPVRESRTGVPSLNFTPATAASGSKWPLKEK